MEVSRKELQQWQLWAQHLTAQADSLTVHPGRLQGGEANSFGDHRMAMALAIAACGCSGPVTIRGAQAVSKSYPHFWEEYRRLGGKFDVL